MAFSSEEEDSEEEEEEDLEDLFDMQNHLRYLSARNVSAGRLESFPGIVQTYRYLVFWGLVLGPIRAFAHNLASGFDPVLTSKKVIINFLSNVVVAKLPRCA